MSALARAVGRKLKDQEQAGTGIQGVGLVAFVQRQGKTRSWQGGFVQQAHRGRDGSQVRQDAHVAARRGLDLHPGGLDMDLPLHD